MIKTGIFIMLTINGWACAQTTRFLYQPGPTYGYGGNNTFYKEFDLSYCAFYGGPWTYTEIDEGDVFLTGSKYSLFGNYGGGSLPLKNVAGIAYQDDSVTIENVRKTDNDSLEVAKYPGGVHYRVQLSASCGSSAHRYIRISVHGRKVDLTDLAVIGLPGWQGLYSERSNGNGEFKLSANPLDSGFAYYASLPEVKLLAADFDGRWQDRPSSRRASWLGGILLRALQRRWHLPNVCGLSSSVRG